MVLDPGQNYARPPTPFLARRHFSGEGGGGVYFEAPRGRNFIRPPLYTTKPALPLPHGLAPSETMV